MTEPFLKWAGGKRWLSDQIAASYQVHGGRLIEPFAGGAAIFFNVLPRSALLADTNAELIATYEAISNDVEGVIQILSSISVDRTTFISVRSARPADPIEAAARFVYLNRTAFNGLYRVNREGLFNVPFGPKPGTDIVRADLLRESAAALMTARLACQDFRVTLQTASHGDFVYIDPPYTVRHNSNGFNRYNARLFSWEDQIDLASAAADAAKRGATVLVSNADHQTVHELYSEYSFSRTTVSRLSRMAASPKHRGPTTELLFVSRDRSI